MKYTTVITSAGLSAIAAAVQTGTKVDISHMAVGDGGGTEYTPDPNQTALKGERWRGQIADYRRIDNKFTVTASMPAATEAFVIRELALYMADGICFAISNVPSVPHMPPGDGLSMEFDAVIPFEVDNADSVQITVNPFGAIPQNVIGKPGGVASLDSAGHVPAEQLPSLDFDPAGTAQGVRNELTVHTSDRNNPHGVTKAQVGLDRVDNTPDAEKQVSYAATAGSANALNGVPGSSFGLMVLGSYVGDDQPQQEINLGFQPRCVQVTDRIGTEQLASWGMATNQMSFVAIGSDQSHVTITPTGFRVYYNDRNGAWLNISGILYSPYYYIAWK